MARLLPIHVAHYEQLTGVQRRSIDRLSDMEPQSSAPLHWGLARHRDMMTFATMTLHALPDLPIVLLERFDHLTEHVDCNGDDGEMSLTFKSKPDFERASNAWRYINEHEDHRFLAIANHDGCAPEDERQPYIITNVREDPKMLTTYLTSHPIALHEVAHTFDLDWGHFKPHELRRQRRDQQSDLINGALNLGNSIKNGANGIMNDLDNAWHTVYDPQKGSLCNLKDRTCLERFYQFSNKEDPTAFKFQPAPFTFGRNLMNTFRLDCKDCWVNGGATVTGNAKVQQGEMVAGTLTAIIHLIANLHVAFVNAGPNTLEKVAFSVPIIDVGIPFASFEVPNLFQVGAGIKFSFDGNVNANKDLEGGATFAATLPTRTVTFDFIKNNNVNQGEPLEFEPPRWEFRNMKGTLGVSLKPFVSAHVGVKVGPDGSIGEVTASVDVPVPNCGYEAKALLYNGGACKDDPKLNGWGLKIVGECDVEIKVNLNVKLPGDKKPDIPLASQPVAKPVYNVFYGRCQGLNAPVPAAISSPGNKPPVGQKPEETPKSKELKPPDGTNPNPENENPNSQLNSDSGTGESVADANRDSSTPKYSISDDVLGLGSNPDSGNYNLAENQNNEGVQLPANLGASPDVASGQVAPPAYGLSNDKLGIASNDLQPSDPQQVQLANALIDPQTPSSGSNVATSSGSPFELGSLPSNTGSDSSSSDPNYLAFIPGQDTNQYTASLQRGGNSINAVSGGSGNTDQASANAGTDTVFGTDNKFGAYSPSNALLSTGSTTNSPSGIANTAQLSTDNNDALLSSTLGVDSNLSPAVTKRTLMGRAANRVRSFW
ncbi:hypothetical protein MMC22_000997 [Lobaria immixta]|nr:hypothetical protein [Lobaria immixta]